MRSFGLAYGNYVQEYRKNAVNGASPVQLVVMLYDGALRFMEAGRAAMVKGDLTAQNHNLQKAQRIVLELMATLNMDKGGEISQNLMALYTFVLEQLVEANVHDEPTHIDNAMKTMSGLRESWAQLELQSRTGFTPEVPVAA
ncbi:MAG: flagellar export chaperone FliS [Fimbriimonas sp.]